MQTKLAGAGLAPASLARPKHAKSECKIMRVATLKFLRAQKERLEREADLIRSGARKILRVMDGQIEDISVAWLRQTDQQIDKFEEIIAAVEARLW